jgi:uncharacterized membrane protein YfcA
MPPATAILALLAVATLAYAVVYGTALWRLGRIPGQSPRPTPEALLAGFVTNFFDTLGIGSFATSTVAFRARRMVPDELIPGTLNAGHTLPTIFQAFLYITAVQVDPLTLVALIGAATLGGTWGAGIVAGLPRRKVQYGVGFALSAAAVAMLARQWNLFPAGGTALRLEHGALVAGIVGNFVIAAVSTLGIGFYAPCMTLVSLLGMNPLAAFPIMMGSSAFLMPAASSRFVLRQAYFAPVALGLTIGGLAGVPLAAFVVKSLPLEGLRWLVIVVVAYAAIAMVRSARQSGS